MNLDPKRIWSSPQLPTLPTVAMRLVEISRDPETEIRDVIEVIKSDPALAAKIVKAANSSYFGIKSEIRAIDRAVPILGTTVSTSLALSFSLNDASLNRGPLAEYFRRYWKQSIVQAAAAEALALRTAPPLANEFFLCGLLQDIGRLAMLKTIPQEYRPVLEDADANTVPVVDVEIARLGFDHVEIGAKLMEHWKLPEALVESVQRHHANCDRLLAERESPHFPLFAATAVSACIGDYFCAAAKGHALDRLRQLTAECFQFGDDELDGFIRQCDERIEQAAHLFNVDVTDLGDPADLMDQAKEQLVQLALREHVANTQATVRQQEVEKENEQLESRNRELQKQALHDPLTNVYNRQFFDETLEREVERCQRTAAPLGVLFLDLDRFKSINDTYGHQFGDRVLQQAAQVFLSAIRTSDMLARYGGEEFVILVNLPTEKSLARVAERIRQRLEVTPIEHDGRRIPVTCSIGASIALPDRGEREVGKRLIAAADACLYDAKHEGRNRICCTSLVSDTDRQLVLALTRHRFSRWLVSRNWLEIESAARALLECPVQRARVGDLAVRHGYLTPPQLDEVLEEQERSGQRFGTVALRLGMLTVDQLAHILSLQHEDPKKFAEMVVQLGILPPDRVVAALEEYLRTEVPPRPSAEAALA
jgi:diguanylate cyclase (GGDEF)-like protein